MALIAENVLPLVGCELDLQPEPGWWWDPRYPWPPTDRIPLRCVFRLDGFGRFNGELVGGFGELTVSPYLELLGHFVAFELRAVGEWDFDRYLAPYNLVLRTEPIATELAWDEALTRRMQSPTPEGWWLGYGCIGVVGFSSRVP